MSDKEFGRVEDPSRIMLAESVSATRRQLTLWLRGLGYDVLKAENGLVGLATLQQMDIDLFVLSATLNGIDGLELLSHARQMPQFQDTPALVVAQSPPAAMLERGKELRVSYWLSYPLDKSEVLREIGQAMSAPTAA